ncbi:hypothetical protein [Lysinibacillus antri]|uniref:DUF624 domain-containing protein n=1 Tax=Lysinibacillus antri TaxID=2498145 RepID=A0A432LDH1_9BACI|nr:hypothetical protein [Lysinibacillus antri]RUL54223.1 hypothetical protein EK386_06845 [Lysinibacillus antri]
MIRNVFDIYNRNWSQILTWSFLIILPVTIFSYLSMVYVYSSNEGITPHYIAGLAFFLNFILCIPPFVKMVLIDKQDDVFKPVDGLIFFVKQFGLLVILTSIIYWIAIVGILFLFIPTFVGLLFLLVFPFFSEGRSVKTVISNTTKTIVRENISLLGDLIVIISINVGLWVAMLQFLAQFENNLLAYLIIRVVLNILVFPLLYIYLTLRYRNDPAI